MAKKKQIHIMTLNNRTQLLGCVFCHGYGVASFVNMDKVPNGTNMVIGDKIWRKHEELGQCPEGCIILN